MPRVSYTPFSIIITTRCRPQLLQETLHNLSQLDYPVDSFEVVVAENAPGDALTQKIVQKYSKQFGNFHYVSTPQRGASVGRNTGISRATFNHVVFIDDDVLVPPELLKGYHDAWRRYPTAKILGGRVLVVKEGSAQLSAKEAQLVSSHDWCFGQCEMGSADKKLNLGELLFSANMSMKLSKKEKSDLVFDERLGCHFYRDDYLRGEDLELCTRYILSEKDVIFIADERLTTQNVVSDERFTDTYIQNRYFISGIELGIIEAVLRKQFPSLGKFFFRVVEPTKTLESRIQFLTDKFKRTMLLSYYLNRSYFQKSIR